MFVSCRERAVAVGASCFLCAVGSYRPSVLVCLGTAVVAACVSGALCGVAEALATWVVAGDCCLFVNCL